MGLSSFLAQNAIKVDDVEYIASPRFVNDSGEAEKWIIRCISSTEDEALRNACVKRVKDGKRGMYRQETDFNLYLGRLAAKCTVYPDLNNSELQDSYGVMGADILLKTMLTAGEFATYLSKIQEVNGFDITLEDEVDEAKN